MIKYMSIFRLVLRCLLVARKENSTCLTGRSKNLDPTGNPTGAGRPDRFSSLLPPSFSLLHCCLHFFHLAKSSTMLQNETIELIKRLGHCQSSTKAY